MLASEIIRGLPGSLEWVVLFDLSPLRRLADDETVRAMFFLPGGLDLDRFSHVVLTSQATLVAPRDEPKLLDPTNGAVFFEGEREPSLYGRFSDRFDLFPGDDVDCLAVGETPPFPPVLLHLRAENGYGEAKAVFAEKPSGQHYELLKAIGVEYLGVRREGPYFVARFRNHLPTHIHSGVLAHFGRTSHCNLFFLQHGWINERLENGLIEASTNRINWAAGRAREAVLALAREATSGKGLASIRQPPPPAKGVVSGDVVPLGFLLGVLSFRTSVASIFSNFDVRRTLMSILQDKRQESFWPHYSGGPASSTTTALVLQGLYDPAGVEALEVFAEEGGGYYPYLGANQRGAAEADGGGAYLRADYATTCLIRALRKDAGLDAKTSVDYLESGFQSRSGLHFANPYLVDWALARALEGDGSAQVLRDRLAGEILDSMNDDGSFGLFDVPMSSAFAILSLAALGRRGRTLRVALLRLLDFMEPDGTFPPGTPFYSAQEVERRAGPDGPDDAGGRQWTTAADVGSQQVSLYFDGDAAISTSAAALALLAESLPRDDDGEGDSEPIRRQRGEVHPRYGCRDHEEYVQKFAIPSYVNGSQRV